MIPILGPIPAQAILRASGPELPPVRVTVDGLDRVIRMDSKRYELFSRSTVCVTCGRKGTYMQLEYSSDPARPHFNLYADDGVMMTKDHVVPKSKGGPTTLANLQTMCKPCNEEKADR